MVLHLSVWYVHKNPHLVCNVITLSGLTTPYYWDPILRRQMTDLKLTLIFLDKLMVYRVAQQVYGVVSPDSVIMGPQRFFPGGNFNLIQPANLNFSHLPSMK